MNDNKIMCAEDFEKCFNVRLAEKCCANCKHGECEYEGYVTCRHHKRNDGGYAYESGELAYKICTYNSSKCYVCDQWEAKSKSKRKENNND